MKTPKTPKYEVIIFADQNFFKRGDVMSRGSDSRSFVVSRVYRRTWFRRLLCRLGFWVPMNGVKVKPLKTKI